MKKNIYKNLYDSLKNSGDLGESPRIKIMLSLIDGLNLTEKNILDIGCHDGTLLSLVKNRNNNFFGLDASGWAVEEARRKNIDVRQFFFDDAIRLPHEDGFFDLVVAGEIIEHIFDTDFFLSEIRRVLKPEGRLLISTPNVASLGRRLLLLLGRNPHFEISPNEPESAGHIRYFTFETLGRILAKHRFKILRTKSDCVNFSGNGKRRSKKLAGIFPKLGASIICLAEIDKALES
jgi:2-polyprenyl-3-methyl-5-hydroxy-6-metoxy-1,4-benzoquinol methylase